ncbi:Ubiquinone biosynthesis protein coq9, mitochondrial [Lecanora helva]
MVRSEVLHTALKLPVQLRSAIFLQQARFYHSYEYDQPSPFTSAEHSILSAALKHVPAHGFTTTALTQGARDAGYLDASTNLFPSGPFSIVNYYLVTQRLALAEHALPNSQSNPISPSDVTANIKILALHRLRANQPIIHRWQEALALLSTARHLPTSIRELALLSDELLFRAGSTTVTTAWYTDRAALAAIYASAELFMTTDTSKDFVETEGFLSRRLAEGEMARGIMNGLGAWTGMQAGGLIDGLRSKGVWI